MPCFSTGPDRGTPEYDEWLPEVRRKLDAFTHVVDYYYRKAGREMPQPAETGWGDGVGPEPVLDQILLHLDCDAVDVFHLNDIRNLLREDQSPTGRGYARVLAYCFKALRNGFHYRPTTSSMWHDCTDPSLMLDRLKGVISPRKLRLFAVACCRRVPHLIKGRRRRTAVEVAERYADGAASDAEFEEATTRMRVREIRGYFGPVAAWVVAPDAEVAARCAAFNARDDEDESHQDLPVLLRCVSGDPFRPVSIPAECRSADAIAIAQAMYDSRDFSSMPLLADALQDAGCCTHEVIEHCRADAGHVRGCWVVDAVLGKS